MGIIRRALRLFGAATIALLVTVALYAGYVTYREQETTLGVLAQSRASSDLLSGLPARRRAMFLAVEDPNFESHFGVDLRTPGAGLTTITQSLVKWHYFDEFVPGWRKIDQTLLAMVLDRSMTKDEQLNLYLNSAYLGSIEGRGVRGFDEAARVYFGKDLPTLTDEEFLSLVAMLISPNDLSPLRHPDKLAERVGRLNRLLAGKCAPDDLFDVYYRRCARP